MFQVLSSADIIAMQKKSDGKRKIFAIFGKKSKPVSLAVRAVIWAPVHFITLRYVLKRCGQRFVKVAICRCYGKHAEYSGEGAYTCLGAYN